MTDDTPIPDSARTKPRRFLRWFVLAPLFCLVPLALGFAYGMYVLWEPMKIMDRDAWPYHYREAYEEFRLEEYGGVLAGWGEKGIRSVMLAHKEQAQFAYVESREADAEAHESLDLLDTSTGTPLPTFSIEGLCANSLTRTFVLFPLDGGSVPYDYFDYSGNGRLDYRQQCFEDFTIKELNLDGVWVHAERLGEGQWMAHPDEGASVLVAWNGLEYEVVHEALGD